MGSDIPVVDRRVLNPVPCFNIKIVFPGMGTPMIELGQSLNDLILIMGILILVRQHLYIEHAEMVSDVKT